jgi:uncharacterized membrane protein HdeD (DUF308 family)
VSLSTPTSPAATPYDERALLRPLWWLFLALGLVSIIVGLLAIGSAFVATLASVVVFGVLLLVAGITEIIHAVMVRHSRHFGLHLLAAALYLFTGLFMLEDPVRAATVLTLLLAAFLLVGGLLRVLFSFIGRFPGWPWVVLNGVVDLILGVLIWKGWPESSLWVIGLFVGIDLLFHGWSWVILALTVRTYTAAVPVRNDNASWSHEGQADRERIM